MQVARPSGKLRAEPIYGDMLFVENPSFEMLFSPEIKLRERVRRWKGGSTIKSPVAMSVSIDGRLPVSAFSVTLGSGSLRKTIQVDETQLSGYMPKAVDGVVAIMSEFNYFSLHLAKHLSAKEDARLEDHLHRNPWEIGKGYNRLRVLGFNHEEAIAIKNTVDRFKVSSKRRIASDFVMTDRFGKRLSSLDYEPWSSAEFDGAVRMLVEAPGVNSKKSRVNEKYKATIALSDGSSETFRYDTIEIIPNVNTSLGDDSIIDTLAEKFALRPYRALVPHRDVFRADRFKVVDTLDVFKFVDGASDFDAAGKKFASLYRNPESSLLMLRLDVDPIPNLEYGFRTPAALVANAYTGVPFMGARTSELELALEQGRAINVA